MQMLPNAMIRAGVQIKPWFVMVSDFYKSGYYIIDCKKRQIVNQFLESNSTHRECLKIELLPFYDYDALPFCLSLTSSGLNLINVKTRRTYMLK